MLAEQGGVIWKWMWAAAVFLAAMPGCKEVPSPSERETSTRPKAQAETDLPTDVDALKSLPYLGSSPANANQGVTVHREALTCPGYRLYSVQMLSMAELIDDTGRLIRRWRMEPSQRWERAELLPNGDLVALGALDHDWNDGGPGYRIHDDARYIARFDFDGRLLWKRHLRVHHDVEQTPDGHLLTLAYERRMVPRFSETIPVRDDQLVLLDSEGHVVESRSLLDAAENSGSTYPLQRVPSTNLGGPPWLDLFHSNSCEWLTRPELTKRHPLYNTRNVLFCSRHQDRVAILDWDGNTILWAWGRDELSGPHDAQMLANGHVLIFDNGLKRRHSRVVEVDPLTGEIAWQYQAHSATDFFTWSKGSAQRLPNGNTLIADSDKGRAFEVTESGDTVWEFLCPHRVKSDERAAIVRVIYHPPEGIDRLRDPDSGQP